MRKYKDLIHEKYPQAIYCEATREDFMARIPLQESAYGELAIHEDDVYLELHNRKWGVTLSLVKETGMLHIPYLINTYRFTE
ncbi:hypothetical protein FDJ20_gp147 [Vibrio phage Thalassa]|uniref:Uncharacterized protein n=1 Tax=Vibrio phage Thalassa TaxID=2570301 RepID=A0A2H5BH81_9CAUD|nr:hypothetical protein FDJ20_gp147 [Vibrio phage Thalassa]AUG85355.1 hypothetical protein THALASSA_176 [Vibrio phage Thalassa]